MTDHSSFLAAICADPDDDSLRLIYADWLEDQGDADRAEFIRVQCELFKRRKGPGGQVSEDSPWLANDRKYQALRRRERELFEKHPEWFHIEGLRTKIEVEALRRGPVGCCNRHADYMACDCMEEAIGIEVSRGFVDRIELACADFMQLAGRLFRAAPITEVRLTDREPHRWDIDRQSWMPAYQVMSADQIPWPIAEKMDKNRAAFIAGGLMVYSYPNGKQAHQALSDACVAYGRKVAVNPKHGVRPATLWQ